MTVPTFVRYVLRTTDVDGARAFYERVIGEVDAIVPLPESARARGAPAHWLGHLGPVDVGATISRWTALGGAVLGPPGDPVVVRDPNGAVIALTGAPGRSRMRVSWHQLSTRHVARASEIYVAAMGWEPRPPFGLPAPYGVQHAFAYEAGAPIVGAIADITERPTVHEHWLHAFEVASLDASLAEVRRLGGEVIDVVARGEVRSASGHDPQGAIFAMQERHGA